MKKISLHSHTDKSDGQLSPAQHAAFFVDNDYLVFGPADHHYVHTKWLQQFGFGKKDLTRVFYRLDKNKINPNYVAEGENATINYVIACEIKNRPRHPRRKSYTNPF